MDTKDISDLNPWKRIKRGKKWTILVIVAIAFGMYGSYKVMQSGKGREMIEWAITTTLEDLSHEKEKLHTIQQKIKEARAKGELTDNLEQMCDESLQRIERLKKNLDLWKKELEFWERQHDEIKDQSMHQNRRFQLSRDDMISTAYATEKEANFTTKQKKSMALYNDDTLRRYVLFVVLGVLAVVYLIVNYKVWFSSNPKNMELASDLMKTITGFWIGLGTAAF